MGGEGRGGGGGGEEWKISDSYENRYLEKKKGEEGGGGKTCWFEPQTFCLNTSCFNQIFQAFLMENLNPVFPPQGATIGEILKIYHCQAPKDHVYQVTNLNIETGMQLCVHTL